MTELLGHFTSYSSLAFIVIIYHTIGGLSRAGARLPGSPEETPPAPIDYADARGLFI
jgi:hypothetical protein